MAQNSYLLVCLLLMIVTGCAIAGETSNVVRITNVCSEADPSLIKPRSLLLSILEVVLVTPVSWQKSWDALDVWILNIRFDAI